MTHYYGPSHSPGFDFSLYQSFQIIFTFLTQQIITRSCENCQKSVTSNLSQINVSISQNRNVFMKNSMPIRKNRDTRGHYSATESTVDGDRVSFNKPKLMFPVLGHSKWTQMVHECVPMYMCTSLLHFCHFFRRGTTLQVLYFLFSFPASY